MSSQNKKEKLLQIVHNFFLKSATVVSQSRSLIPNDNTKNQRVNKWFNLETYDTVKDDLKLWKSSSQSLPPMIVETYLDLREFKPNQSLVLLDEDNIEWPVNTRKSEIVIERWLIELDVNIMDSYDEELPILYKKLIITFRYLYALSRLLPSYKLLHTLENNSFTKTPLRVGTRILDGNRSILSKGRIGLSKPIISSSKDHLTQRMFTPIATSMGLLKISVSYRNDVRFQINETEKTLSMLFSNIDDNSTSSSKPPSSNIRKVFKSGTVSPPCSSPNLTRNESNASIAQNLKIQRTGSTGVAAPQGQTQPLPTSSIPRSIPSSLNSNQGFPVELSSSGGTPKYSSSFGRNTRRSSLRRSSSIDKNTPGGSSSIDDNLKDFVKMMDSKQDLRLNYNPNIQDSLGRFQMMRSRNDLLSESMTASLYSKSTSPPIGTSSNTGGGPGTQATTGTSLIPTQQSHSYQQRLQRPNSRSPSHSPNTKPGLSISPRHYLPLISSRLSGGTASNESLLLDNERRYSSPIEEDQAESDINKDQQSPPMKITSMPISRITSTSPSSLNNIMPRMSFSVGPSNPTIAATQTHAKLHKPQSSDSSNTPNSPQLTTNNSAGSKVRTNSTSGRCTNPNIVLSVGPEHHWQRHGHGHGHGHSHSHSGSGTGAAEDDDLLFTMSDMNLK